MGMLNFISGELRGVGDMNITQRHVVELYIFRNYFVGANSFAHLPNGQIFRANKFAPTDYDASRYQIGLTREVVMLAAKIQENFEGLGI